MICLVFICKWFLGHSTFLARVVLGCFSLSHNNVDALSEAHDLSFYISCVMFSSKQFSFMVHNI